ncbi:alpha/beta hydrolase [Paeniglutamicibacter gangotriensis]|uniref:Putative abhydrolase n=1 Tax=Paeniglutamicibacter gangotriensis Lz1y TaxID=1276920 RepID=M7MZE4_9MICC|nr:alpha/beta hydrolase [Paeniglutamicibacter gangotriensis]EMR00427.1 putative abhydrolase [Paeniglutamicibacter gangotriensis Lz1y]
MNRSEVVLFWAVRLVSALGAVAVIWAGIATGDMLVHGHPAYAILLGLLFIVCTAVAIRSWRRHTPGHRRSKVLRTIGLLASCGVLSLGCWLVPYSAAPAALSAMVSDGTLTVTESPTQILMTPTGTPSDVGVFFQPGALVDARAYAAVLRPLAESGHTVVIPKQPFGIAFLSTGAFNAARTEHRPVARWVLGGHSLGGVVAAIDAQSLANDPGRPVAGVLFFASYPASDMRTLPVPVLSLSASNDALTTQEKVKASRSLLPKDTTYTEINGGVHANFGDYGTQSGDGEPTISRDEARTEISAASLAFVQSLGR